jgi:thiosulfate/3-mercaptopyruvate sulfurtransferase
MGHGAVAVLDGGLAAWTAAGGALESGPAPAAAAAAPYPAAAAAMPTVMAPQLLAEPGRWAVLDARAPERYSGAVEPLDSVAGHIPGARNRFFKANLRADGSFRPADELRSEFAALGGAPAQWVHQCGSGVTACHNLLAMEHAGLPGSALYPGSWSEWSADPERPVARG